MLKVVEELTLQQMSINHRHRDTRTRATGLLMLERGLNVRAIAAQLGASGQSAYDWSHAWRERGICGLMGAHDGGGHALLTDAQIAVALEFAHAEPLTLGGIAQRVEAALNGPLPCKIETLGEALKRNSFSFKRNRYALKKKRNEEAFTMKQATLEKLQQAAREDAVRLLYLDEAGFHGSPPVQRSWSPRGLPHQVEPNHHCRRSVICALDFGGNTLIHAARTGTIKAPDVECFIDSVLASGNGLPTVIVLDNASVHHGISEATRQRWLLEHKTVLFYLPAYSPELNMIEIVWRHLKYRWRRALTWTREIIDAGLSALPSRYGTDFQIDFYENLLTMGTKDVGDQTKSTARLLDLDSSAGSNVVDTRLGKSRR
ncbi:IS630 family transposase [Paraburkholderia heleia]|uniref:IS630 family transposase n=1 Tax=Paraburkholderia heleia TaxID=634127 RepID=UPI002AB68D53|nr:IS630 family transposase [Paraburkholderia heleia]